MAIISWRAEWNAISARIEGLMRAGEFFYRSIQKHGEDPYGASKRILLPESAELYDLLVSYCDKYASELPMQAVECLKRFLADFKQNFEDRANASTLGQRVPFIQLRLTALSAFRSQFGFCLADVQDQIRATAERAFLHLRRCIVADSRYQDQWRVAFNEGETSCEKLGGVHLLWHGIWAFKVDAAGGRTDLVMGNRIDNPSQAEQTAVGMVLTEWKKAKDESQIDALYEQGRKQASGYSAGVLGGVELADTRYIVVVTSDTASRDDVVQEGIKYRFVNIAVNPKVPSQAARSNA